MLTTLSLKLNKQLRRIVEWGIPVMCHIGLTPQSIHQFGGFKVQGRTPEVAVEMIKDAQAMEESGAFAIVLETVPTLPETVDESY